MATRMPRDGRVAVTRARARQAGAAARHFDFHALCNVVCVHIVDITMPIYLFISHSRKRTRSRAISSLTIVSKHGAAHGTGCKRNQHARSFKGADGKRLIFNTTNVNTQLSGDLRATHWQTHRILAPYGANWETATQKQLARRYNTSRLLSD